MNFEQTIFTVNNEDLGRLDSSGQQLTFFQRIALGRGSENWNRNQQD